MNILKVDTTNLDIHCVFCGCKNIDSKGIKDKCEHLVYVGTNEGGLEYDRYNLLKNQSVEDEYLDVLEKLDDTYSGLYFYHPESRSIELYVIYKNPMNV